MKLKYARTWNAPPIKKAHIKITHEIAEKETELKQMNK